MLRIGIIGLSPGNGHPYSWAAICNGYDPEELSHCPFPVIPQYLAEERWPDAKIPNVKVTHIWTQDQAISEQVAKASLIEHICEKMEDMIGQVDAVLLARDDAENHLEMSKLFLEAGIPLFIDKPFALSQADAEQMLSLQQYPHQLYSCSSLRFAEELKLTQEELEKLGAIKYVEAQVPKYWDTYAVHLLDPIIQNIPNRGPLQSVIPHVSGKVHSAQVIWEDFEARICCYSHYPVPLEFRYFGENDFVVKKFKDSFAAFKASIVDFIGGIQLDEMRINRSETMEIVTILEKGR